MRLKEPKPERKRNTDSASRHIFRRVVLVAVTLVLLGLAATRLLGLIIPTNTSLKIPENAVAGILTPLQTGFSSVVESVVNYLYKLKLRANLEIAYNDLKQENEQLVYQAMLADELQYKLSVYEDLYDEISVNEGMNPLVATVIDRDSGNYFSVFTINKGSNEGVKDYMAVTMEGALVGYTYNVSATKASVRTIIDSQASIAALISSTRDQGTVRGTLGVDGTAMCRMYYLPDDHLPRPGDTVVTSGVGMSFPKGIPIGTVRESTRGMESNKSYIVVEPTVDFEHIEYVIVLRYQPDAEAVEARTNSNTSLALTPLETAQPIPTIQIGSDFYQLAPTPEPTESPTAPPIDGSVLLTSVPPDAQVTPTPSNGSSYEYQVPSGMSTNNSYGFTLAPTATPTPTPPPLDVSVEEDQ
ncbi:MAG TPA: rod shape-determining protein MreC [Candidatus Limiplasma sp.]|nr:rod shape-determining protein MreC [Candidatus Limiplasma sp.]HPS82053.1 rod shape-determining protein MreC [Candidatus Limiplasma sp.]